MRFKTLGVVSSLAIVAGLATPVFAQDNAAQPAAQPAATESEDGRTNVITVTAQFREQNLQDTPIAITAVNSEMLDARGQTNIAQVAAQAPNVSLTPQPQNGGTGLIAFIRGVGQTDFNYALDPGVGLYVDDVYIPTLSSSLLELMDVERIEILRGPQGTLAGKNSIGGAIKLFSEKPSGDGSGSLQVTYGSYNRIDVRGMADFKVNDQVAVRASGIFKGRDGYVDLLDYGVAHPNENVPANNARGAYPVVGTQGGQSIGAGRIMLRWEPSSTVEVNLSADYTRERSEPQPTVLIAAGKPQNASNPVFNPSLAPGDANAGLAQGVGPGQPAWLPGKDGTAIPYDCRFVPAGQYSCDNLSSSIYDGDPRYISYANFLDGTAPTSQAPFKPYSALQNQDFNGWGLMGNVSWDITDNLELYWVGSWREYTTKFGQDQDASPVPVAQLDNRLDHRAWSQELRLNGEFGDGLVEYTVGGFYMDQEGSYTARVDLNYAGIDFLHGPDTTPSTSKALFANAIVHPVENWSITGGLRRSWDEKTYTYFRRNPDGTIPGPCEFFTGAAPPGTAGPTGIGNSPNCLLNGIFDLAGEFKGSRWDWRIATDYRFSDEFLAYASIATGYKGGGVNPRPFFGPSAGECDAPGYVAPNPCNQIKPFNPETLITYELGFKSDFFDRRVRLNGAVFYNDYQDIILILSACPSSPCLRPTNVGEATVKGFELETTIYPIDNLSIDGSLSYIDVNYDKASVAAAGLTGNETFPYTPDWTYSFGVQYDADVGPGTTHFRFDGAYRSEVFTETTNTSWSRMPGRFLANARIWYTTEDQDWEVGLEVQNLFDKYYFLSVSDITKSLGSVTGVPGLPRTWAVSVKRNF
ncbi:TonB-dependent receptor [Croceibacterium sp. LX-88]|uniref:TonB-dependent receptor n=1 Tax=Croceibacterium selenioxidans TaxID=2838833 RepID=A0ABS5W6M7_9SPHN|nr:TonB-dependent receptor [Croceibacterium selenioxidans]MBT2135385.1 TonB-dependent receptor [Croceibacterium selenioxidans]